MVGLDSTATSCSVQSCSLEDTTCTTGCASEERTVLVFLNQRLHVTFQSTILRQTPQKQQFISNLCVMGKVKGGVPWALPWEASLTKLLASARLPASSFAAPSWPGVWLWLSSTERVTCCSVSVTSCRVCSLTTAVWKTGFGLMRTCRKPEELLTGVCSSLYLIRNYSPNEWKHRPESKRLPL